MARRLSTLALLALLVSACSVKGGQDEASPAASGQASETAASGTVSCALDGSASFRDDCTLERSASQGRTFIVLRHPDGGFRRVEELEAGKRYKVLDGADEVQVEANQADLELTIGDDHYLFPGPTPSPDPGNAPKR